MAFDAGENSSNLDEDDESGSNSNENGRYPFP